MTGRRRPGRDRGSFTAELAAGLPALMLLLFAALTAVAAVSAQGECLDAARAAALAVARGDPVPAGAGASVRVAEDAVTAEVRRPVRVLGGRLPVITVHATAVAAREPEIVR